MKIEIEIFAREYQKNLRNHVDPGRHGAIKESLLGLSYCYEELQNLGTKQIFWVTSNRAIFEFIIC